MAKFVKFPGTAGSYASTDDVNLLDCDSSWFAQGTGGLWTVGTPSTDQAWINTQSLKVLAGASTAITPATDAAFFSLYVYSAAGDTFDINGSTPVAVPAGVWTRIKEAGPDGTYTVSAVGAADYYVDGVIVQATDAAFVPSLRIVGMRHDTMVTGGVPWDSTTSDLSICGFDVNNRIYFESGGGNPGQPIAQIGGGFQLIPGAVPVDTAGTLDYHLNPAGASEAFWEAVSLGTAGGVNTPGYTGTFGVGAIGNGAGVGGAAWDIYSYTSRDGIDGPIVAQFNAEDIFIP